MPTGGIGSDCKAPIAGGLQRRVVGLPRGAASPVKERRESIGGREGQSALIKCLTL